MDSFAEHLVKKRPDSRDNSRKFLIIFATVVLCIVTIILCFWTGIWLILIITCAIIYGAYYLMTGLSVEYEYAVTNGEMDVDKIVARRKRTHLITVDVKHFDAFGPYTEAVEDRPNATLVLCSDNTGEGEYYADLTSDDLGEVRVIFSPNDTMIEAIEESLPPLLKRKRAMEKQ